MSLPSDEVERLHDLRTNLPELRLRVRRLKQAGWTFQSIASALQTYRSTVRAWSVHPFTASLLRDEVPLPPSPPAPRLMNLDSSRFPGVLLPRIGLASLAPRLHPLVATELAVLSEDARRVRGHTALRAHSRIAAARFDDILFRERIRGVTIVELARASRLTSRAVRSRLPRGLPGQPPLITGGTHAGPVVLLYPSESSSRKWRTFVREGTAIPMALWPTMIELPSTTPANHYVLSLTEAQDQLNWDTIDVFPKPL